MRLPVLAEYLHSIKRLSNPPKSFFPNIVFRLVRTERRHPNQVVFRCPTFLNKFDITKYLESIYKIRVMNVATINYPTRYKIDMDMGRRVPIPMFKKAIVTLDEEFEYPPTLDLSTLSPQQLEMIKVPLPPKPAFITRKARKFEEKRLNRSDYIVEDEDEENRVNKPYLSAKIVKK